VAEIKTTERIKITELFLREFDKAFRFRYGRFNFKILFLN